MITLITWAVYFIIRGLIMAMNKVNFCPICKGNLDINWSCENYGIHIKLYRYKCRKCNEWSIIDDSGFCALMCRNCGKNSCPVCFSDIIDNAVGFGDICVNGDWRCYGACN